MQQTTGTDQSAVGEKAQQHEHMHPPQVHSHDHYHVAHVHRGGPPAGGWSTDVGIRWAGDDFEHKTRYHSHAHDHGHLVHAHRTSEDEEQADHNKTAHSHHHDDPTGESI